MCAIKSSI